MTTMTYRVQRREGSDGQVVTRWDDVPGCVFNFLDLAQQHARYRRDTSLELVRDGLATDVSSYRVVDARGHVRHV